MRAAVNVKKLVKDHFVMTVHIRGWQGKNQLKVRLWLGLQLILLASKVMGIPFTMDRQETPWEETI